MSHIYVLKLEKNKWYIGYTEQENGKKLLQHGGHKGAKWTKIFRPIEVIEYIPGTKEDEADLTLQYMWTYGWWNVIGGPWTCVIMKNPPEALIQAVIRTYNNDENYSESDEEYGYNTEQ